MCVLLCGYYKVNDQEVILGNSKASKSSQWGKNHHRLLNWCTGGAHVGQDPHFHDNFLSLCVTGLQKEGMEGEKRQKTEKPVF